MGPKMVETETVSIAEALFNQASQEVAVLRRGSQEEKLEATANFRRYLKGFLTTLAPVGKEERIFRLKYADEELSVFPDFVGEFLRSHIENQSELLAYIKSEGEETVFGLRDEDKKTDFALTLSSSAIFHHPIGFWGSYPTVRYEWQGKNEKEIGKVSKIWQEEFPRPLSEEEATLMLTTARFIEEHLDQSSR